MDTADGPSEALRQGIGGHSNKHTWQLLAMLAHDKTYDADAWLKHPMVQRPAGKHAIRISTEA